LPDAYAIETQTYHPQPVDPSPVDPTPVDPQPISLDTDNDGLLDAWELNYFGDLMTANATTDSDNDGVLDTEEENLGTDPTIDNNDSASAPVDSGDVLADQRPMQPTLGLLGTELPTQAAFDGVVYTDPNGDSLSSSLWEISQVVDGVEIVVFSREISGRTGLQVAPGVLDVGQEYNLRVRHRDTSSLLSYWSDPQTFSTATSDVRDTDNDGTDDAYFVDGNLDRDGNGITDNKEANVCGLSDINNGGDGVGLRSNAGQITCLSISENADLPVALSLTTTDAPYGFFNFRVDGLEIDEDNPARIEVTVYLNAALSEGSKWYKYDDATGVLSDYSDNTEITVNTDGTTQIVITLVDGGIGDADGVVNGIIIDPSGPVGAGTTASASASDSGGGGGGSFGIFGLLMMLLGGWLVRKQTPLIEMAK